MKWQIQAMKIGQWDAIPGPELFWMSHFDQWTDMWLLSVVARASDGTVALVNTGPAPDYLPYLNSIWRGIREDCQLRVAPEEEITAALARHDIAPDEVTYVFCTPFQAYTTGNLPLFRNARICLSGRGWDFFFRNPYPGHPHDFRPMVFPPAVLEYLIYQAEDRVLLLEDEQQVAAGLTTFWTGGHHRASIAVAFDTEAGRVVISDTAFLYANVEQRRPLGISENIYETLDAYRRFESECDILVPLYEKQVFDRYPHGRIAG